MGEVDRDPHKTCIVPKGGQVESQWDAMPRGVIHEAECKPSLWLTGGPPKQQPSPCGNHPCCCKENRAAVEGTYKFAIALRMISQCLLDCWPVVRSQIWGGLAPCIT